MFSKTNKTTGIIMTMNLIKKTIFVLVAIIFASVLIGSHVTYNGTLEGDLLAGGLLVLCMIAAYKILDAIEVPDAYAPIK
jgi:hypothetical protein